MGIKVREIASSDSQIFDYWRDPWGHLIEHSSDVDLRDAAWGSRVATLQDLLSS